MANTMYESIKSRAPAEVAGPQNLTDMRSEDVKKVDLPEYIETLISSFRAENRFIDLVADELFSASLANHCVRLEGVLTVLEKECSVALSSSLLVRDPEGNCLQAALAAGSVAAAHLLLRYADKVSTTSHYNRFGTFSKL